jgi:hypothetical protein
LSQEVGEARDDELVVVDRGDPDRAVPLEVRGLLRGALLPRVSFYVPEPTSD